MKVFVLRYATEADTSDDVLEPGRVFASFEGAVAAANQRYLSDAIGERAPLAFEDDGPGVWVADDDDHTWLIAAVEVEG